MPSAQHQSNPSLYLSLHPAMPPRDACWSSGCVLIAFSLYEPLFIYFFKQPALLTSNVWEFFPPCQPVLQLSGYQLVSYSSIQVPNCPVRAGPTGSGLSPTRLPITSGVSHKAQATRTSDQLALNWELPRPSPLIRKCAGLVHRTQDSALLTISGWLQMMQLRKSQMEEMHRARL